MGAVKIYSNAKPLNLSTYSICINNCTYTGWRIFTTNGLV
jgi:hypothetical protein